jgi:hypothetical protein
MRNLALGLCASLCAIATASTLETRQTACTRESLKEIAAAYVAAQTGGTVASLKTATDVAYFENDKAASLATGILSTAIKIDLTRSLYDTTQCATYTEVIAATNSHPYVIGTQMRIKDGMVTKIDSIITDQGDWLFNATGTLRYAKEEKWDEIPEASRDTRAVIQAAGDAYCDLFKDKSVKVPWGTPCARLEGGSYTGRGQASDSCNVGVPSGLDLHDRRYVIDEVLGTVDIFLKFGTANGLPDSHEFRVEKGKLRYVHTLTVMGN